jgi:hypothetical protein
LQGGGINKEEIIMLDLTFGEQVKIILSRKGMTIKELAETIEERTGKKMSRQNLTQRLGRDNFQEQDMRMIADILGCPFQLSILADSEAAERAANVEDVVPTEKELHKLAKTKARKEKKAREAEQLHAAMEQIPSEVTDMSGTSEKEMTLGDYMDIHEELVRRETGEIPIVNETIEEPVTEESVSVMEEISDEPVLMETEPVDTYEATMQPEEHTEAVTVETTESVYEEPVEEIRDESYQEEVHEVVPEEAQDEAYAEEKKEETPHEKKLTGWRAMFQRRNKKERQEEKHEEEKIEREIEEATEPLEAMEEDSDFIEYEEPVQPEQTYYEEQQSAQEEEIAQAVYAEEEDDDAEDLERGELNPYTGHEYESNSVRMHPKRIGYVQVYDRRDHAWTDMTEWAFLGYQERKKALLGKDYEEPIYLD